MTAEETAQVQAYISNLQAQQTATLRTMEIQHGVKLQNEQRARKIAQKDSADMVKAMHEIWKLAGPTCQLTPEQFAVCIRQIMNYYCPDFDIPF